VRIAVVHKVAISHNQSTCALCQVSGVKCQVKTGLSQILGSGHIQGWVGARQLGNQALSGSHPAAELPRPYDTSGVINR
jgi:hypothetical protein